MNVIEEAIAKRRIKEAIKTLDLADDFSVIVKSAVKLVTSGYEAGADVVGTIVHSTECQVKENPEVIADIGYALYLLNKAYQKHEKALKAAVEKIGEDAEASIDNVRESMDESVDNLNEELEAFDEKAKKFGTEFMSMLKTGKPAPEKKPAPKKKTATRKPAATTVGKGQAASKVA